MKIDIPNFDVYPSGVQATFILRIKNIIDETFIYPADKDYLTARWQSINKVYKSFYWSALQAIEKYLKANLLYEGIPVVDYGHRIIDMAKKLDEVIPSFTQTELLPVHEFRNDLSDLWGTTSLLEFLGKMNTYGHSSNRYDYFGSDYEPSYLFKLDQVVHLLRSRINRNNILEKITNEKGLEYTAYEKNAYFAPQNYIHGDIYQFLGLEHSIPSIKRAVNGCYGYSHVFENWLCKNIKITRKDMAILKKS